ncbi:MAG: FMN-binding protein [Candidatus Omnitrophica bacterium]|nr:FMN-binding protein [Candidatus Omnitrophota bacterium]MCF7877450.1 FMN-binding protein [Candidatus Omnitrophota bacterium]MCF7878047.1 FMN-binding protein [Candidatus Omnitrophota bacterium]MCF7892728.1 FMN-binding protein [Candidatus Omnitrophota bacterium]
MKEVIKISATLTLICLICAFLLALAYNTAEGKIEANQKKAIENSINKLAPEATRQDKIKIGGKTLWKLYRNNDLTGYAAIASGQGYGGEIRIMIVTGRNLEKIKGIEIIESNETPGLGSKIQEKDFKNQFKNLEIRKPISYTKEKPAKPNQIQAITGATISSKSVVEILNKEIEKLRYKIQ